MDCFIISADSAASYWLTPVVLLVVHLSAFQPFALLPAFDWAPELRLADIIPGHDPPGILRSVFERIRPEQKTTRPSAARGWTVDRVETECVPSVR